MFAKETLSFSAWQLCIRIVSTATALLLHLEMH